MRLAFRLGCPSFSGAASAAAVRAMRRFAGRGFRPAAQSLPCNRSAAAAHLWSDRLLRHRVSRPGPGVTRSTCGHRTSRSGRTGSFPSSPSASKRESRRYPVDPDYPRRHAEAPASTEFAVMDRFRRARVRSPLPTGADHSLFGTVSLVSHREAVARRSWLSFSSSAVYADRRASSNRPALHIAVPGLPTPVLVERPSRALSPDRHVVLWQRTPRRGFAPLR